MVFGLCLRVCNMTFFCLSFDTGIVFSIFHCNILCFCSRRISLCFDNDFDTHIYIYIFFFQSLLEHQKNRKKPMQKHFKNSLVMAFTSILCNIFLECGLEYGFLSYSLLLLSQISYILLLLSIKLRYLLLLLSIISICLKQFCSSNVICSISFDNIL